MNHSAVDSTLRDLDVTQGKDLRLLLRWHYYGSPEVRGTEHGPCL